MSAGNWFWIIYIIIGLLGAGWGFTNAPDRRYIGGGFVVYVLIGLLGWGVFGPPLK
jgi:hypothetical protein